MKGEKGKQNKKEKKRYYKILPKYCQENVFHHFVVLHLGLIMSIISLNKASL